LSCERSILYILFLTMSFPTFIYKIATPTTSRIYFDSVFGSVELSSADELRKISLIRDEVVIALERASSDASIKAIERYLPHLGGVIAAASTLPPEAMKNLKVSWTTPLSYKNSSSSLTVYGSLQFEYAMLLLAYGIVHRNAAIEVLATTLESDYEEKSKIMSNFLCKSAGIFEFMKEAVASWLPKPEGAYAEFFDQTYIALASLSLAEAQELAIKKAVLKATNPSIVAKLCVDVANKVSLSAGIIRSAPNTSDIILQQFEVYLTLSASLFNGLASKHLALHSNQAHKYGLSIGIMKAALTHIPEDIRLKNMPVLDSFVNEIRTQRKEIKTLFEQYTSDNNSIYFEPVVDGSEIGLPEGRSVTKSLPFTLPPPTSIQIVLKKGYDCIIQ